MPSFIIEPDLDEPESEVAVELISLQEKTPRPTEVEDPLVEISLDLLAEPTVELLSSSPVMRVPLSLRSPDTYDPLQIFYNRQVHKRSSFLLCRVQSIQSSAEMTALAMLHISC